MKQKKNGSTGRLRTQLGLIATMIGFVLFVLGAYPALFGMDRSPVIGFVQIAVFLVGLGVICVGGYLSLASLWNGGGFSILADIGLRLVATGYVIAVACGMADVFGFGTQPFPKVPHFGVWQAGGIFIGQTVIAVGFVLLIPFRRPPQEETTASRIDMDTGPIIEE